MSEAKQQAIEDIRNGEMCESETDRPALTDVEILSLLPEGRDEALHRLMGVFQRRREKWHQQPFVRGFPRYQDYVEGDVWLLVELKLPAGLHKCLAAYALTATHSDERFAPILTSDGSAQIIDQGDLEGGDKHVVLIPVVELPREPQHFIATFVRAQPVEDKIVGPLKGLLYRSLGKGSFHFFAKGSTGQGVSTSVGIDGALDAHPAAIKGGAKAEDCVSRHQCDIGGKMGLGDLELPRLLVETNDSGLLVFFEKPLKGGIQVLDYYLGPSDFETGAC